MPELTPEERERIYQEEKARIEARQQIEDESRPSVQPVKKPGGIGGYIFFLAICFLVCFFIFMLGAVNSQHPSSASTPTLEKEVKHYLDSGASSGLTMVFTSDDAFDESSKSAAFKDEVGFRQVVASGSAFFVSNGTHVITLETSAGGAYALRIQDGPHKNKKVYANREDVK
jgi:hypothetical protein